MGTHTSSRLNLNPRLLGVTAVPLRRFLDVLAPGPLYVGCPSSDAVTQHLAAGLTSSGNVVRNDVKVRCCLRPTLSYFCHGKAALQK